MEKVNRTSLYLALEHYAKNYVDYDALLKAQENGNYDKALLRLAIEFSKYVPHKAWYNVDRAEIIDKLEDRILAFGSCNYINLEGKAFVYVGGSSKIRVIFADSKVDVQRKLSGPTSFMHSCIPPRSTKLIHKVEKFVSGGVIINGEFTPFNDSILKTVVNAFGRTAHTLEGLEAIDNE